MAELGSDRAPWATRILHLCDSMHREVRTWRLFGLTWAGAGFEVDAAVAARLLAHERDVARFALDLERKSSGGATPGDMYADAVVGEWVRIREDHGALSVTFFAEAGRFAAETKERGGNWGVFTADLR